MREAVHHDGPDKVHHVLPRGVSSQQTCQKSQHQTVKYRKKHCTLYLYYLILLDTDVELWSELI